MDDTALKIRQYLMFRIFQLYSVLVSCLLLRWNHVFITSVALDVLALATFSFFMTASFILLKNKTENISYFITSQVVYDLLFTTALIYYTGTNDSIYVTYYLINIMFTATLVNGYAALIAALVCGALYFFLAYFSSDNFTGERSYLVMTTETSFIVVALLTGQLVDELKRNKARIGRLERLSDEIVDSLDAGLIGVGSNGTIIKINRTAKQILNLPSLSEDSRLDDVLPDFGSVVGSEVREINISGTMRRFLVSRVSLSENSGMLLFRDLTEILDLEEQVKQNDHLASVGSLAASLAHEIRNPIASISGAAQMLQGSKLDSVETIKLYALIIRETERVDLLVSQLLRFARAEPVVKESCDIVEIINNCVESLKARPEYAKSNVEVVIKTESSQNDLMSSNSNREQMIELFANLLLNAFQALSDEVRNHSADKKSITVAVTRKVRDIEVLVSDNGPGIPKDFRRRIFDPFFTTKKYGTGLGLARVYKIVKDHDGRIDVESRDGKEHGTSMRVRIPVGT